MNTEGAFTAVVQMPCTHSAHMQELQQALRERSAAREQLASAKASAEARAAELALTKRQLQCAHDDIAALEASVQQQRHQHAEAAARLEDANARENGLQLRVEQLQRSLHAAQQHNASSTRANSACCSPGVQSERGGVQRSWERIALLQAELQAALAAKQAAQDEARIASAQLREVQDKAAQGGSEMQSKLVQMQQRLLTMQIEAERTKADASSAVRVSQRQVDVLQAEVQRLRAARRSSRPASARTSACGNASPARATTARSASMSPAGRLGAADLTARACVHNHVHNGQHFQPCGRYSDGGIVGTASQMQHCKAAQAEAERRCRAAEEQLQQLQQQVEADSDLACARMASVLGEAHQQVQQAAVAQKQADERAARLAAELALAQAAG